MKDTIVQMLIFSTSLLFSWSSMAQTPEELINKGEYMQALTQLESMVSKSPENASNYILLGKAKAQLGDCSGAIESWDKYASLDQENSWKVNVLKADCLIQQGNHEEAIDALSKYLVHDPYNGHSYLVRGKEYFLISKYGLAVQDYSTIISRKLEGYNTFDVYYERGLAYIEFGKYKEALGDFNEVIKLYPKFNYGYFYKGSCYWNMKKYKEAIPFFTQAIALEKKDLHSFYNRGLCYQKEKKYDLALADFKKVILIDPNFDEAYNEVAMNYYYIGDYSRSEKCFNEYISKFSNYSHAYFNRGAFYADRKQDKKALLDFDSCINLNPKDADAYYQKGLVLLDMNSYIEEKDYTAACEALSKANELGNKEAMEMIKRYCGKNPKP